MGVNSAKVQIGAELLCKSAKVMRRSRRGQAGTWASGQGGYESMEY